MINQAGLDLIKSFEGCKLKAYRCSAGVWTIGIGHAGGVREGQTITQAEAEVMLQHDLHWVYDAIADNVRQTLTINQFSALCSLIFNIGRGAFEKSTLLKLINAGNMKSAGFEFLKWDKVNKKPLAGLTRRRKAEKALWDTPTEIKHVQG